MNKKYIIFATIVCVVLLILFLMAYEFHFNVNRYSWESRCTSNYNLNNTTTRFAVTNDKDELVLDDNGERIIKTSVETKATLSIHCECDVTYNNKQTQYQFDINKTYDHELDEESKDCTPICRAMCEEKIEELKTQK